MKKKNLNLIKCGIEKEALRVTSSFQLSKKRHPISLGEKLTHPLITTDFAEMQIEWTTPTFSDHSKLLTFFRSLMSYTQNNLDGEMFWPLSMPPKLPKSCQNWIATYGTSHIGKRKEAYRNGLCKKYGSHMQMISGFHYNVSLPLEFWKSQLGTDNSTEISNNYLHIMRNFIRDGWILNYLFGASPTPEHPFSTSIRNSPLGYQSKNQNTNPISYNSIGEYVEQMESALSRGVLQIENELYSVVRPKRIPESELTQTEALAKRGIEYLEIRALDLDPFSPISIQKSTLDFTHIFLLHCLFTKSPKLSQKAHRAAIEFDAQIALEGRNPRLKLAGKAAPLIQSMRKIAKAMGLERLVDQAEKLLCNTTQLPSAKIASNDHMQLGKLLCNKHTAFLKSYKIPQQNQKAFECFTEKSLAHFDLLETAETMEASTRIVIEEALRRHITIEILDQNANFLRLTRDNKSEIVAQATKSSKDAYLAPIIMENKQVTKQLLNEAGLSVPLGRCFYTLKEALSEKMPSNRLVVKPNTTNFGIGLHFVAPNDTIHYKRALKEAFEIDNEVLVEPFIHGPEYRFLIICNEISAVALRDPAHVIGDGSATVAQLAHSKRRPILMGPEEIEHLTTLGTTPKTIPKRGEKVYLRANSNVSTGGETTDATETMPSAYKQIALDAAKAVGATICGVDMIIEQLNKAPNPKNHAIIELNFNPALYLHQEPDHGSGQNVAADLLDCLGFPFKPITKCDCC